MSYVVLCTFDLKRASSRDYDTAYAELARLGLQRAHDNSAGGKTVIPTTTVMGAFNGASAGAVRDDVRSKVRTAFAARGLNSEIFLVVGGADWTWGAGTT